MIGIQPFGAKAALFGAFALGLVACSRESDTGSAAVSEGERQALEEAASMLDEQRVPIDAIAPTVAIPDGNETDSATDSTGDGVPQSDQ